MYKLRVDLFIVVRNRVKNTLKIHKNIALNKDDDEEVHKFLLCGNVVSLHHLLIEFSCVKLYACLFCSLH